MEMKEIVEKLKKSDVWDMALLKELCTLADMEKDWNGANGQTFEQVALNAAEKLGVEII